MIQITADTRRAVVTNKELLTVGSAGIQVEFTLSEDWDGLSKLAVFRVGDEGTKVDVALGIDLTCVVPPEVLLDEGEPLFIGIYGANEQGTIIIPTIWASAGVVKPGTEPNTPASAEPTPEIWAQILGVATDAEQTAADAMSNVEAGLQELSAFENTVQNAEDQRQANELARIANETDRVAAETERSSAENSREVAESGRVNAELTREVNEGNRRYWRNVQKWERDNLLLGGINAVSIAAGSQAYVNTIISGDSFYPDAETINKITFYIPVGDTGEKGDQGDPGDDGVSPTVTVTSITGGHTVTITDADHPNGQSFNVMDGADGQDGADGSDGADGVIQSVNGKSAASITLDAGDLEFDDTETYASGSVGAELSDQKNAISQLQDGVLSATAKAALLNCFAHVAWADANGQTYYDALENAISTPSELVSISAVYTQTDPIYTIDSLNELKPSLVVTATYSDSTTETVTDYTLSGTLTEGTSIITVSYSGKTTTFNVTVTGVATGYTFYDYITRTESIDAVMGSGSGILTDIGFSTEQTFELKFRYTESTRSASNPILGIRGGQSGTKEFGLFYVPSIKKVGYWYDGTDTTNSITDVLYPDTIYTIKVQPVGVSQTYPSYATININGTDYSTDSTGTGVTFDSWLGFFKYGISATATSGSPDYFAGQQIGRSVIRNSNTEILHDIRPAYNGSFYGLYDLVGEKFYYYNIASMYTCNNWQ